MEREEAKGQIRFLMFNIFGLAIKHEFYFTVTCGSAGKESACNAGDLGSILGLGRSPGEGKGYPLQYSGLENSMDCIVHVGTKSWIQVSNFHFQSESFPSWEKTSKRKKSLPFTFQSKINRNQIQDESPQRVNSEAAILADKETKRPRVTNPLK